MRKTWTTLVVLGILLCMFVSLGASAHAAEDALTILAVNGDALTDEQIAALKNEYANGYILDVTGNGTSKALDIVFNEARPFDTGAIGPQSEEHVPEILYLGDPMTLEANGEKITLIGVNYELDDLTLGSLLSAAEGKVIAVGKADGGEAVKMAGIDLFLTTDASDGVQTMVTANVGVTQVVNVGNDSSYPITKVTLDGYGDLQAEPMEAPAPGVIVAPGPVESEPEAPEEPAVCNVTYDANGANGGYMDDSEVTEGNSLTLPENGFTYDGYDFTGWSVDGTTYNPGETVAIYNDTVVTAQWTETYVAPVYNVTYDPNGADGGWMDPAQVTEGNPLTMPECGFTYTGYTFAGWNVENNIYQPGDPVFIGGDAIAYALWDQDYVPAVYTVAYVPNGANGGWMDDSQVTEGNDLTLPECGFTYDGYNFIGWSVNGETRMPGETVAITGDTQITALWEEVPVTVAVPTIELTYTAGEGTGEDVKVTVEEGTVFAECTFAAPEGKHFDHWDINGEAHNVNDPVTITESAVATAIYAEEPQTASTEAEPGLTDVSIRTWNLGGTDPLVFTFTNATATGVSMSGTALDQSSYTVAPSGNGCTVTLSAAYLNTLTAGSTCYFTCTFAPGADGTLYKDTAVIVSVNAAAPKDPGFQGGSDMYTWKNGGTDPLKFDFANAKVAAVSVGAEGVTANTLAAGTDYTVGQYGDHGQTITFQKTFLDNLQPATYNMKFTFLNDADGSTYNEVSTKLDVRAADVQPTAEQTRRETWNRAYELPITFSGLTPSTLEIKFGSSWTTATYNTDYKLNGSTITLLPAMINGGSRWQAWGNGGYTFRVNFTDGTSKEVSVQVEGTAPTTQTTAAPTATPVPGTTAAPAQTGPTAPVTGDETPIALYVAILVLLVAALAIVIILLTRKKGSRR